MFRLKNKWVFCLFVWAFFYSVVQADEAVSDSFHEKVKWSDVLSLPSVDSDDNLGVAGAYSGFVGDYLVVAGGANFPDAKPWNGGRKTWWNVLYYKDMENVDSDWLVEKGILPSALAYGVSIQLPEGVLCIGGCDSVSCSSDVFLIRMRNGKILIDDNWPSLPVPLASATGALLDDKIYIAGGHKDISKQEATSYFFELDLADKKKGWKELPSWPGSPRGYAVSAVQNDGFDKCFYLFSGRDYHVDGSVEVLKDGYVYNPRLDKWKKLEGRFPFMAGTAVPQGVNHILFVGGSDTLISGSDTHPGFSNALFAYHTVTCTLKEVARSPFPLAVTTNIAYRENTFYITSGEVKPGVRTPSIVSFTIEPYEKGISVLNALVIALYFSILSWMGYYFSKKQKNTDDYFKGGGRIPWWVVGLSIFGTGLSAITFMAIPAKAYSTDWSYMLMNAGILMVVPVILYMFIPFFRRLNITTAYEYLEKRFNYSVRLICSLSFILFQIGRMGVVLYLPAIALNVVTGFDIFLCIGLMGILSLVYTMIGGIEAVVWTDALQVVVLLGGALLCLFIIILNIDGGLAEIISEASDADKFSLGSTAFDLRQSTLWTVLVATFFTNLTTYGTDQTMVQRYMTTETERQAKKSVLTNAALCIPATLLFFFVGTALYVYYRHNPSQLSMTLTDGDAIFPWYIYSQLPDGITGLLISGVFAAAMSTLSSSMNSAATAYVVDIYNKMKKKDGNLGVAKRATAWLGIAGIAFAFIMATWEISSLWDEFNKLLGLILGSMGGLFLLGMLTRKANSWGTLMGVAGSVLVQLFFIHTGSVHLLLYTTTGFLSCFIIGYLCSWFTPSSNKNIGQFTIYKLFNKNENEKL